eukprot:scaffold776_cov347-Pavlova_lutheri.AAC.135
MKVKTVQIVWHGKEPVFSLDFHPAAGVKPEEGDKYLLATGGGDNDVRMWEVSVDQDDGEPTVRHVGSLSAHSKSVNVVRFSPSGQRVASGDDQGEILLWRPCEQSTAAGPGEEDSGNWKVASVLRGHKEDVQDLSWSPDSTRLVSGSVDHYNIVWNVPGGKMERIYEDHTHYVQGVSWDPCGKFFASLSGDRTCRIYCRKTGRKGDKGGAPDFFCQQVMNKLEEEDNGEGGKEESSEHVRKKPRQNLFHGDSLSSFFRRLAWSPEGSFLAVPTGIIRAPNTNAQSSTVFIYGRGQWKRPVVHLPGIGKPVTGVKFCPVLFKLQEDQPPSPNFDLPYRIVFAAATLDTILLYDTQQSSPLAMLSAMHYAPITDLAWSPDGRCLAFSSHDGYCSIVTFKSGELGEAMSPEDIPEQVLERIPMSLYEASQKTIGRKENGREEDKAELKDQQLQEDAATPESEINQAAVQHIATVPAPVPVPGTSKVAENIEKSASKAGDPEIPRKTEPRRIVPTMVVEQA